MGIRTRRMASVSGLERAPHTPTGVCWWWRARKADRPARYASEVVAYWRAPPNQ
jgi:hypothetical protein